MIVVLKQPQGNSHPVRNPGNILLEIKTFTSHMKKDFSCSVNREVCRKLAVFVGNYGFCREGCRTIMYRKGKIIFGLKINSAIALIKFKKDV